MVRPLLGHYPALRTPPLPATHVGIGDRPLDTSLVAAFPLPHSNSATSCRTRYARLSNQGHARVRHDYHGPPMTGPIVAPLHHDIECLFNAGDHSSERPQPIVAAPQARRWVECADGVHLAICHNIGLATSRKRRTTGDDE